MRALTLTQPWAGLVAANIKRVENRPRSIIKREDFGKPFAIHASREIDEDVYARIAEIAPELATVVIDGDDRSFAFDVAQHWYRLSRITSAVIGVATVDKVFEGGWDANAIREYADDLCFSNGEPLGPQQVRWFFGPIGYVLRDVIALPRPVPCRGYQGFWTLPPDVATAVQAQLGEVPRG